MANIFEIKQEIENFDIKYDEETGEVTNFNELEELQLQRDELIENVALWIKNLDYDVKALKEEEKSLADRRKAKENKIESLKGYLISALDGEKFETTKVRLSYRKSQRLECDDLSAIPEEYLKTKINFELDKNALKTAIKNGAIIEGCRIVENTSLQIK